MEILILKYRNYYWYLFFVLISYFFAFIGSVDAATFNVPAQGSLSTVCGMATNRGDVINISAGTFTDGGQCDLYPGVKIIGAGKESTVVSTSIYANSGQPVIDGSNEISGIRFENARIFIEGRSNVKIHDNIISNAGYEGVHIQGKAPNDWEKANGRLCNGVMPPDSSWYCEMEPLADHNPAETDWIDGLEIYNNEIIDTNLKLNVIRGAKIHHNNIDNSSTGVSGVGNTSFWWNAVDFYNNRIIQNGIGWSQIAVEVWKIENDTKFRDNFTNGWFSILENPKGISTPYSWEITGNTFSSNVPRGDVNEALETSYYSSNVLVANNYFENTGSNKTYSLGIAIWGNGLVKNYTIRNNIFRNLDGGAIAIQSTDTTKDDFDGQDLKIFNNTFDHLGNEGVAIFMRGEGPGNIRSVQIKNNIFRDMSYAALVGYGGHNMRSAIDFTYNVLSDLRQVYGGSDGVYDYIAGRPAFSRIENNMSFEPELNWSGNIPNPFYQPMSITANVVDKGTNVGRQFVGTAPDVGANEYGMDLRIGSEGVGDTGDNGDTGDDGDTGNESCIQLGFVGGSASPAQISAGGTYVLSCNYGVENINSVKANNDIGECEWTGWSGTTALFNCQSGSAGTRTNTCSLITGTSSNSCASTNAVNTVVVSPAEIRYSILDVIGVIQKWRQSLTNSDSDVNNDDKINARDLGIMMSKWSN
ncbi:MAG: hypothetical protein ACD_9C00063G0002 [uncultured bacterium]|nr:MAG: hypothetical protein ACD_9C00063G0002 [uncultured bacterium]